jgi:chromosome partitioning protein
MAIVITVAQQKGGAGKTMIAANLAALLAASARVALLDIDPQKSLARWHALRGERAGAPAISFADVAGWRLAATLDKLRASHDVVLIDSPPHVETDARLAVRGAGLVIVPMQPSLPDLWAAEGTFKLARDEKRKLAVLFNRAPTASRLRLRLADELAERRVPVLAATLGNRTGYAVAFAQGLGVTEASPRSVAAAEIRALLAEIREITG